MLVVQSDQFNRSGIATVVVLGITTNMSLAFAPGNLVFHPRITGLPRPSVANVSQLATVDRTELREHVGRIPESLMRQVEDGLRLVLGL